MSKIAVLISGECRGFAECLPTMKFIDASMDVYVSTWDKTSYNNQILGINESHEVTEQFIRDLLPNATILVESLDCFESRRYSDRMVYRWLAGWQMIKNSGKRYDKVIVIRPDLFFDPNQTASDFQLSDEDVLEIAWLELDYSFQDCMFAGSYETIDRIFSNLTVRKWHMATEGDIHRWWANFVKANTSVPFKWMFKENPFIFFRASKQVPIQTMNDANVRHNDWRDSLIIHSGQHEKFYGPLRAWGEAVVENAVLTYRSNRLNRTSDNSTLVIFSGLVRNTQSASLCLPVWGKCDVAVVSWHSPDTYNFTSVVRADYTHTFEQQELIDRLRDVYGRDLDAMHNPQFAKMVFLWQKCHELFSKSKYERIVIARPDAFYYADGPVDFDRLTGFHTLNAPSKNGNTFFQDVLMVFDKQNWHKLHGIFDECMSISIQRREQAATDPHEILHDLFIQEGYDHGSDELTKQIKDAVIQRDTFKFLLDDVNGYEYYKALFYDCAAWWRRTHSAPYGGYLRQPS